ncbi:MAG: hypothetical protein V4649_02965 [Bacteroidota bacterium]
MLFPICAYGQGLKRNTVYAGVSCNMPGGSATYNRLLTRRLALGGGISVTDIGSTYGNVASAAYVDIRSAFGKRRSTLLLFADIGAALYTGRQPDPARYYLAPTGFYSAVGLGYCYRIFRRGAGPYASLGMQAYKTDAHTVGRAPHDLDYSLISAYAVLSLGFKF